MLALEAASFWRETVIVVVTTSFSKRFYDFATGKALNLLQFKR